MRSPSARSTFRSTSTPVKNDPYEVALIFEYPRSEHTNLFGKIDLCLESFALGNKAQERLLRRGRRTSRGAGSSRGARRLLIGTDGRDASTALTPSGSPDGAEAGCRSPAGAAAGRSSARRIGSMDGGFDPEPDLIPFELHDRDPDRRADQDPFRSFPAENQHPALRPCTQDRGSPWCGRDSAERFLILQSRTRGFTDTISLHSLRVCKVAGAVRLISLPCSFPRWAGAAPG